MNFQVLSVNKHSVLLCIYLGVIAGKVVLRINFEIFQSPGKELN